MAPNMDCATENVVNMLIYKLIDFTSQIKMNRKNTQICPWITNELLKSIETKSKMLK